MNKPWKGLFPLKFSLDEEAENTSTEKKKLFERIHRSREHNPKLRSEKKKMFQKKNGYLCCEICRFNFEEAYGELGRGFIEFHHTKPAACLTADEKTRLLDLALVCPNCHAMLHMKEPGLSIEELKSLVGDKGLARV